MTARGPKLQLLLEARSEDNGLLGELCGLVPRVWADHFLEPNLGETLRLPPSEDAGLRGGEGQTSEELLTIKLN